MTSPLPPPTAYFAGGQMRGSPHALPRAAATHLSSTPPSSPSSARLGWHSVQVRVARRRDKHQARSLRPRTRADARQGGPAGR